MDKRGRSLLALGIFLLVIGIFSSYFVVAGNGDGNIKIYDDKTKTVTIKDRNDVLVGTAQLLSEEHKVVIPGDFAFEIKINPTIDDEKINDMKFYDYKSNGIYDKEVTNPSYRLVIYDPSASYEIEVPDYNYIEEGNNSHYELTGSHKEIKYGVETEYNIGDIFPKEEVIIRGYYNLKEGEHIEMIPTIMNVKIDEWVDFVGATKYEQAIHQRNNGDTIRASTGHKSGNTFTVGVNGINEAHNVVGISIWGTDEGNDVGTCNYSIVSVNASGVPNDSSVTLATGSITATNIPNSNAWYNVSMTPILPLQPSTKYAFTAECPNSGTYRLLHNSDDVYVKLNSILNNKANLTIQKLHEEIPAEQESNVEIGGEEKEEPEEKELNKDWIYGIIAGIIIILILAGSKFAKEHKKRREWKKYMTVEY